MPELAGKGRVLKRFRVAREGQTVDGRTLSRLEIQQIAESYDIARYGARINVEHIAGYSPEPPFNAYGDIVLVDAVEEDGKLSLYNTLSALPNLLSLNEAGQKIYPSIEFYRDFAGSGKAYQVGLGLTDTPASLGTEAIKFSSANPNLLRTVPDTEIYMSATQSAAPAANPVPAANTEEKNFFAQLKELLTPAAPKPPVVPEDFNATVTQALVTALTGIKELKEGMATLTQRVDASATPAAPASTPAETPAAPAQPTDPIALLSQQFQQMQQQLQTLASTPVNTPPAQTGPAGDQTPY